MNCQSFLKIEKKFFRDVFLFEFSELFTKFEKFIKFPNEFFLSYFRILRILKYSENSKRQKICGFQIKAAIYRSLNFQIILGVKNICAVPACLNLLSFGIIQTSRKIIIFRVIENCEIIHFLSVVKCQIILNSEIIYP